MKVYKALQLSLHTYAPPTWQHWAAPSRIGQLERCQNKALRVVTRQLKSAPVETLIAIASKRATALANEKAHRLPLGHPRMQILAAPSRHRLKRPSWRSAAQASTNHLPAELVHRAPIDSPFSCPWEDSSNCSVHADHRALSGSQDDTNPYLSFISHLNARFIGDSGDTKWWHGNGGNRRRPCQTPRPSSRSNSPEQLSPHHTTKRKRPRAWHSSGSCNHMQPRQLHGQPVAS